jgi:hypothetical protein
VLRPPAGRRRRPQCRAVPHCRSWAALGRGRRALRVDHATGPVHPRSTRPKLSKLESRESCSRLAFDPSNSHLPGPLGFREVRFAGKRTSSNPTEGFSAELAESGRGPLLGHSIPADAADTDSSVRRDQNGSSGAQVWSRIGHGRVVIHRFAPVLGGTRESRKSLRNGTLWVRRGCGGKSFFIPTLSAISFPPYFMGVCSVCDRPWSQNGHKSLTELLVRPMDGGR